MIQFIGRPIDNFSLIVTNRLNLWIYDKLQCLLRFIFWLWSSINIPLFEELPRFIKNYQEGLNYSAYTNATMTHLQIGAGGAALFATVWIIRIIYANLYRHLPTKHMGSRLEYSYLNKYITPRITPQKNPSNSNDSSKRPYRSPSRGGGGGGHPQ